MGIISKVFTFVAGTTKTGEASQVNADFDALYSLVNGSLDDANISATAAIQQSKILNLPTDMQARMLKAGDIMTGTLELKMPFPNIRLFGTDAANRDWRIITTGFGGNAGRIFFDRNDGTEATPVWVSMYSMAIDGIPALVTDLTRKDYVDAVAVLFSSSNAISRVNVTTGDFSTGSPGFVGVSNLSTTLPTRSRRCQVSLSANVVNNGGVAIHIYTTLLVDGVDVSNGDGLTVNTSLNGQICNASFTYTTDLLSNAVHTFSIYMKVSGGTGIMFSSTPPAILTVTELGLDH
jgi:hypothetical protein